LLLIVCVLCCVLSVLLTGLIKAVGGHGVYV